MIAEPSLCKKKDQNGYPTAMCQAKLEEKFGRVIAHL